jgi:hypothetical protein
MNPTDFLIDMAYRAAELQHEIELAEQQRRHEAALGK